MKFAVAVHGTRGDIEPAGAVAQELLRRGHEVRLAVPPNLREFVTSAGLPQAASYGVDSQQQLDADLFRELHTVRNPLTVLRESQEYIAQGYPEMSATLTEMAADADLILTGTTYQDVAGNVAEHHDIPLAALHYFPFRPNRQVLPVPVPLPMSVIRRGFGVVEWGHWRLSKPSEDAQRRNLGLPPAKVSSVRRMIERGALEIQAYDEVLFPGLSAEFGPDKPFVGSMSMQLGTETDADVMSWIAADKPPIYFGFGSMPVKSPAEAVSMIDRVCAELGERALISAGVWDLGDLTLGDHVKLVGPVNHAAVFPLCRVLVHHGGAGTTAAAVRSGVPAVVLWVAADQPVWANQIRRLKLGVAHRFSSANAKVLHKALRTALQPDYQVRARAAAARMIQPADSAARTADLLEKAACRR
ncbi:UDP:flavonoid glycosyltransferase YjiC (YdhE family) [Mycobacterium sp. MAA66]|uniref:glycosyltransferase n=1 Tax=Mycobacterium sp. MAA66 TaxID=3156297 RepID=UPI003516B4A7